MYLADLHAHTSPISHCCQIPAEETIALARDLGFSALAITNHYVDYYFTPETYDSWIESYIAEWKSCREIGERIGVRIFRGIEVTITENPALHMLIYGADEAFLRENPAICDMKLSELYKLCQKHSCAFVQGHPKRGDSEILPPDVIDGLEINCHKLHASCYPDEILAAAKKGGLAVTVGGDYHGDSEHPLCGVFLPDRIKTDRDLADFILTSREFSLRIDDPSGEKPYETVYKR